MMGRKDKESKYLLLDQFFKKCLLNNTITNHLKAPELFPQPLEESTAASETSIPQ